MLNDDLTVSTCWSVFPSTRITLQVCRMSADGELSSDRRLTETNAETGGGGAQRWMAVASKVRHTEVKDFGSSSLMWFQTRHIKHRWAHLGGCF